MVSKIKADKVGKYLSDFGVRPKDIRGYNANQFLINGLKSITPEEKEVSVRGSLTRYFALLPRGLVMVREH